MGHDYEQWKQEFLAIYLKRVGFNFFASGAPESDVLNLFQLGLLPDEAVSQEIQHYQMYDMKELAQRRA